MENKPWLPYLVTDYICSLKPRRIFEWGSGESTLFWAHLDNIEQLVSVEHDQEWVQKVRGSLPDWVDYHFIPYEEGEIGPDPSEPIYYKSNSTQLGKVNFKRYATYIDNYDFFDLVLIDGMARASCLVHATSHVRDGGCIVLDNTGDRPWYLARTKEMLFGNYERGWEEIRLMGYGPILEYKWETTIFINKRKNDYENNSRS